MVWGSGVEEQNKSLALVRKRCALVRTGLAPMRETFSGLPFGGLALLRAARVGGSWLWHAHWEKVNRGVSKPGDFPLFSGKARIVSGVFRDCSS